MALVSTQGGSIKINSFHTMITSHFADERILSAQWNSQISNSV